MKADKAQFPGLDCAFLEYFEVTPENQKPIQRKYVPFFEGCTSVVDLACGTGDFLELLQEADIEALGVDLDPQCCAVVRSRGLKVVEQDVLDYLTQSDSESLDGIFSAHLVEHMPFETVLTMFQECYRVLRPGGRIVTVTPNVRSLYAHLDMFYLHFGHVCFYHTRLLEFFLKHAGFVNISIGENAIYPCPLLGSARVELPQPISPVAVGGVDVVSIEAVLPKPRNPLRRWWWHLKVFGVKMIVKPYIDKLQGQMNAVARQISEQINQVNRELNRLAQAHNALIEQVDRPFEAFVVAEKPK